jgi:hypothetical protein
MGRAASVNKLARIRGSTVQVALFVTKMYVA